MKFSLHFSDVQEGSWLVTNFIIFKLEKTKTEFCLTLYAFVYFLYSYNEYFHSIQAYAAANLFKENKYDLLILRLYCLLHM